MVYIPISINLDDLIQEFGLDGNQIKLLGTELTNRISDKYFAAIKQKINTTLRATKGIYLKNLRIETIDDLTKEIILSGWLSNVIESGTNTFDMKPGFIKAKNVRISAKGNFFGSEGIQQVPKNIYQTVKEQAPKPLKESQIPESQRLHQIKDLAKGINAAKVPGAQGIYQHKNSIYTGMQKIDNSAISFRRVGAVSDPNLFWHPGLTKKDLFGTALNEISNEIPILADQIIDTFLQEQGY